MYARALSQVVGDAPGLISILQPTARRMSSQNQVEYTYNNAPFILTEI